MRGYWSRAARRLALLDVHSAADAGLLLQVVLFAAAVPTLLRLNVAKLSRLLEPRGHPALDRARIEKIATYVQYGLPLARPLVRAGCLTRCLTLYYFWRRAGLDVALCFGVGTVEAKFAGHCWLERHGEPFREKTDPRRVFTKMYRIPRTTPPGVTQPSPARQADGESFG